MYVMEKTFFEQLAELRELKQERRRLNEKINRKESKIEQCESKFNFTTNIKVRDFYEMPYWADVAVSKASCDANSPLSIEDYSNVLVINENREEILYARDPELVSKEINNANNYPLRGVQIAELVLTRGYILKNRYGQVGLYDEF